MTAALSQSAQHVSWLVANFVAGQDDVHEAIVVSAGRGLARTEKVLELLAEGPGGLGDARLLEQRALGEVLAPLREREARAPLPLTARLVEPLEIEALGARPDGVVVLNLIDGGDLDFVVAQLATYGETFAHLEHLRFAGEFERATEPDAYRYARID